MGSQPGYESQTEKPFLNGNSSNLDDAKSQTFHFFWMIVFDMGKVAKQKKYSTKLIVFIVVCGCQPTLSPTTMPTYAPTIDV